MLVLRPLLAVSPFLVNPRTAEIGAGEIGEAAEAMTAEDRALACSEAG